MTIDNVTDGDDITPEWGNSVADTLNNLTEEPWITVSAFNAGWDSWYANGVKYRKRGDRVELRGLMKRTGASTSATETMFTLPTGYRPTGFQVIALGSGGGDGAREVRIGYPSGDVQAYYTGTPYGTNDYISLDGISFPTT